MCLGSSFEKTPPVEPDARQANMALTIPTGSKQVANPETNFQTAIKKTFPSSSSSTGNTPRGVSSDTGLSTGNLRI